MRGSLLSLFIIVLASGTAVSGTFEKFTFLDPYLILKGLKPEDTAGLHPESYFSQMDSLGITLTHSIADNVSTNNPYGIRIIGQDSLLKAASGHIPFGNEVHYSMNVYAEAENTDQLNGYWWTPISGGVYLDENQQPIGWLVRPGIDQSGTILISNGPKFSHPGNREIMPRYRLKAWNAVGEDTVCDFLIDYCYAMDTAGAHWRTDTLSFKANQFAPAGQWKTLNGDHWIQTKGDHSFTVRVNWRGNDSLAIDQISFRNIYGSYLEGYTSTVLDNCFLDFYSRINTANHGRFYPSDEPHPSRFWGVNLFDDHASTTGPGHKQTCAIRDYIPEYVHDVDPLEVIGYGYYIGVRHDSASNGDSSTSIQNAYDGLASKLRSCKLSVPAGTPFWFYTQAGRENARDSAQYAPCDLHLSRGQRDPTYNEQKEVIYLPLLYGASGIGYFTYTTLYFDYNVYKAPGTDIDVHTSIAAMEQPQGGGMQGADCDYVYVGGLVSWNQVTRRYEPTERWYAAKEAHGVIDSLWPTVENLTWRDAGNWTNVRTVTAGFVDSIYSDTFPASETFVECARFTSSSNEEYLMLLNRRTLSSDGQGVTIQLNNHPGLVRFHDVQANTDYDSYDSCGTVRFTTHFDPAQLKLFKVTHVERFKGAWAGTWPQYSTIKVVGDITVNSGTTLTIQTNNVRVLPNTDSLSSGFDTHKSEILVHGTLRLLGTQGNRIVIQPTDTSKDSSWYGIVTGWSAGKVYADNVVIRKAYQGLFFGSDYDTVKNSRIEDCFMYGVYSQNAHFTLLYDTLESHNTVDYYGNITYGMRYGARIASDGEMGSPLVSIRNCLLKNVKQSHSVNQ